MHKVQPSTPYTIVPILVAVNEKLSDPLQIAGGLSAALSPYLEDGFIVDYQINTSTTSPDFQSVVSSVAPHEDELFESAILFSIKQVPTYQTTLSQIIDIIEGNATLRNLGVSAFEFMTEDWDEWLNSDGPKVLDGFCELFGNAASSNYQYVRKSLLSDIQLHFEAKGE